MGGVVKGIVFDLYETLVTESGTRPPGVSSFALPLGCDRDAFRREWKMRRAAVTTGHLSFPQAIADVASALGVRPDSSAIDRLCAERAELKAQCFDTVDGEVLALLDRLRDRGLRLAIISNCWKEHVAGWPRSALASRFDCAVFSFAVGVAKPDEAIYRDALRRVDVAPSEAWYIGDGADDELEGARRTGMRAFKAEWFLSRWPRYVASRAPDVLATPAALFGHLPNNPPA